MSIPNYGIAEIKKELQHLDNTQLTELCLRLVRYKKENKELTGYLLFDADNERAKYWLQVAARNGDKGAEKIAEVVQDWR